MHRDDFGSAADGYFEGIDERLRPLALELRALVRETLPEATATIKCGMPVYSLPGQGMWCCSIRASRAHVTLQFGAAAARLDDPQGLLEGSGVTLRHVKLRSMEKLQPGLLAAWLRQVAGEGG